MKIEKVIKDNIGLDADKSVSSLSVIQLYKIIKLATARAISHESDE